MGERRAGGRSRNGTGLAFAWLLLVCTHMAATAGDDQASARGRRLFETGMGGDGRSVEAVFAESATPIPGNLLSCAGCHGRDGRGRAVRGFDPPDITWQTLTKPYALRVGAGRTRPPYTDALVVRAVTIGRDSGGRLLAAGMPRFRLTPSDATDLIAYLRDLGSKPDPGVGAEMLSIGVILPQREQLPAVHDAVHVALDAYREELNRSGGIFGRRVEFSFIEAAADLEGPQAVARALMIEQAALAVVVSHTVGAERDLTLLAQQQDVPLVALRAVKGAAPAPHVFYLSAGVVGELAALAVHAARRLDAARSRLTVLYREDDDGRGVMAALRPFIERTGWRTIDEVRLRAGGEPSDLPEETLLRIEADEPLLVATPDAGIGKILSRLGQAGRNPLVLLPGSTTALEWLPQDPGVQMRILVGLERASSSPAQIAEHGVAEHRVPEPTLPAQETALAAAKLLVEGLRRAGRDVTRARLIDALETIQGFKTGYLPPLSYGPRQHIGFTGALIVPFDARRRALMEPIDRVELD